MMGRICRGVLTLLQMVESESVYNYLKTRKHAPLIGCHRHLGADQSESHLKVSDFQMPCRKLSSLVLVSSSRVTTGLLTGPPEMSHAYVVMHTGNPRGFCISDFVELFPRNF